MLFPADDRKNYEITFDIYSGSELRFTRTELVCASSLKAAVVIGKNKALNGVPPRMEAIASDYRTV